MACLLFTFYIISLLLQKSYVSTNTKRQVIKQNYFQLQVEIWGFLRKHLPWSRVTVKLPNYATVFFIMKNRLFYEQLFPWADMKWLHPGNCCKILISFQLPVNKLEISLISTETHSKFIAASVRLDKVGRWKYEHKHWPFSKLI